MDARSDAVADRELVITRVFDAPRALVFQAWLDPKGALRWWGPKGCETVACEIDARPGGAWTRRLRTADGAEIRMRGVYREIAPPERLVFTIVHEYADGERTPEMVVTMTFADVGGKTRLTLHQAEFDTVARRDGHVAGWSSCLERLADYLAQA
jgi:uncharacterized protein YndB with AHSA1/START domain